MYHMKKIILLLRGINVGGRNKLPMIELKKILEKQGCENVSTYIQSGNVVLKVPSTKKQSLSKNLKSEINKHFGFKPEIILLELKDFELALKSNPFKSKTGKDLHFYFLDKKTISPDIERMDSLKTDSEKIILKGKTLYLYAPDGVGRSKVATSIEKCLGVSVTSRNFNTIIKIQSMLQLQD